MMLRPYLSSSADLPHCLSERCRDRGSARSPREMSELDTARNSAIGPEKVDPPPMSADLTSDAGGTHTERPGELIRCGSKLHPEVRNVIVINRTVMQTRAHK